MSTEALIDLRPSVAISWQPRSRIASIVRFVVAAGARFARVLASVVDVSEGYSISRTGDDVVLKLRGHFTADEAVASTEAFVDLVGFDDIRLIVDLGELKSYDKEARVRWQQVLRPLKKRIREIVFVGDAPPLVRMAASAVSLAVGIYFRFVATHDDIPPPPECKR